MARLSKYGLRGGADFDKYTAVALAETASRESHRMNDPKASFLEAASQTLRAHLQKPADKFQAYFLALFSDKEYTKVLESIAKVDKVFKRNSSESSTSTRPGWRPSKVVCFNCGTPGHVASTCYRRRQGFRNFSNGGRFSPYPRRSNSGQNPSQGQNM
jgi:hypothetical protein